jgi:undecaprenyl diphosphate synthase
MSTPLRPSTSSGLRGARQITMTNQQPTIIPKHIAIIMDGNRRWAKERGLPAIAGHKKVAEDMLEPLVEHAYTRGVKYLTFWAFSTENWQRDPVEVSGIMNIFRSALITFGEKMHKKGIRIKMIGDLSAYEKQQTDYGYFCSQLWRTE